jgi:hypothetical protein
MKPATQMKLMKVAGFGKTCMMVKHHHCGPSRFGDVVLPGVWNLLCSTQP